MNKKAFVAELEKSTGCTAEQCDAVNAILEEHLLHRKRDEILILIQISEQLDVDTEKADAIYTTAKKLFRHSIQEKLKHPFRFDRLIFALPHDIIDTTE